MAQIDLVVMVKEAYRARLDDLAKSLESQGLQVQSKLPRFRTIAGRGDPSVVDKLKAIEGVELVRPQRNVQLPPMDEKVPQ